MGPEAGFTQWLSVFNFSILDSLNSGGHSSCVADISDPVRMSSCLLCDCVTSMSTQAKLAMGIVWPCVCVGILLVNWVLHYCGQFVVPPGKLRDLLYSSTGNAFDSSPYFRTLCALFLFSCKLFLG